MEIPLKVLVDSFNGKNKYTQQKHGKEDIGGKKNLGPNLGLHPGTGKKTHPSSSPFFRHNPVAVGVSTLAQFTRLVHDEHLPAVKGPEKWISSVLLKVGDQRMGCFI